MINEQNVRFVLVNTSHPGNIGATARAIKNMGFSQLYLVNPKYFPHPEATARASGSNDILEKAIVVNTLFDAIADCNLIIGTSARERALPISLLTPHQSASKINEQLKAGSHIAILFGQERIGLTNEELAACHFHLYIPCNPQYASLNVAAAVQIIAYELHLVLYANDKTFKQNSEKVTVEEMEQFYFHLEQTLVDLNFLNVSNPRQMMRKLRRLFNRTEIERNEMNILRGILTAVNKKIDRVE